MAKIDHLMDVVRIGGDDEGAGPVVIDNAGDGSAAGVKLHPLVIINISEHFTRIRAQSGASKTVLGLLLGVQQGRQAELFNSFEMVAEVAPGPDGKPVIQFEVEFLKDKLIQFKEVFPQLDLLGWYCTGTDITAQHMEIHSQMLSLPDHPVFKDNETKHLTLSESPLFLLLDPTPKPAARELPLRVFEHHIEVVGSVQQTSFVSVGYALASEEAERIGVDHIAKVAGGGADDQEASEVALYLTTQKGAIDMLQQRVRLVRDYLRDVRDGALPRDHEILRQLSSLCSRLPIHAEDGGGGGGGGGTSGEPGAPSFLASANDAMLASYLAMITKGCSATADVLDKFFIVHDKAHRSRSRTTY